jgi:hypothetical protein
MGDLFGMPGVDPPFALFAKEGYVASLTDCVDPPFAYLLLFLQKEET